MCVCVGVHVCVCMCACIHMPKWLLLKRFLQGVTESIFPNTAALLYFHFIYLNFTHRYESQDFKLLFDSQFQNEIFSLDTQLITKVFS